MNAQRRKDLATASTLLDQAREIIEQAAADEQDYFDSMPESLQDSDKGERATEIANDLEDLVSEIEDMRTQLDGMCEVTP